MLILILLILQGPEKVHYILDKDGVTVELRKKAKAINFGIMYGMGEHSLSEDLHISRAEAKSYIDSYLNSYPDINRYLDEIIKTAYEQGFVTTKLGRRRFIPELAESNKMRKKFGERVAMNSPIQGTAADIMKIAMIRVHDRLTRSGLDAKLILQVHDELILEASATDAEAAHKKGLKVYSMTNSSGKTWDFGVVPYEPMPGQWIKRYEGMIKAHDKNAVLTLEGTTGNDIAHAVKTIRTLWEQV